MTEREGASPNGEAPDRFPAPPVPRAEPAADAQPAEPAVAGVEPVVPAAGAEPVVAETDARPVVPAAGAEPIVAAASLAQTEAAPSNERAEPALAVDRADPVDPLAPYRPAEPTFRADPVIREADAREFEVPVDTGQLRRISTGQLLIVHRAGYDTAESIEIEEEQQRRAYSWVAAVTGVIGAAASLFVGWMLPLSIAAIVFGVLGLRREEHGRALAFVGIGTGLAGLVFSAVWIGYYAIVFGALPV